jgi:hypothetical protein
LTSRFIGVTYTLRELAKAEPPFGCRIERNGRFQLPSRLTRPAKASSSRATSSWYSASIAAEGHGPALNGASVSSAL